MTPGLTEDDLRRISRFVECPPYRRRPDLLRPADAAPLQRPEEGSADE